MTFDRDTVEYPCLGSCLKFTCIFRERHHFIITTVCNPIMTTTGVPEEDYTQLLVNLYDWSLNNLRSYFVSFSLSLVLLLFTFIQGSLVLYVISSESFDTEESEQSELDLGHEDDNVHR